MEKLYTPDGNLTYEGSILNGKYEGPGTSYYPDGTPLHEGIFGMKGLLMGREYYPNGQVRFEGVYKVTRGYGPNAPEYGTWYGENGEELYHGKFTIHYSGVGYPSITEPAGYGSVYFDDRKIVKKEPEQTGVQEEKKKRTYEEFKEAVRANLAPGLKETFKVSDAEIEKYFAQEEDEIRGGFQQHELGIGRGILTDEAHFESRVSSVAMCLEWSY